MARRSARLQKRSPTPSNDSSKASSSSKDDTVTHLPSVAEANEPAPLETNDDKDRADNKPAEEKKMASQLPQPVAAATPMKPKSSKSFLASITAKTPKNRTAVPSGAEMHPEHHHQSTAKPLTEARWLGFHALDTHPALSKNGAQNHPLAIAQATPTKSSTSNKFSNFLASPHFPFSFTSRAPELSPKTIGVLTKGSEAQQEGRQIFERKEGSDQVHPPSNRKFAVPKGKAPRFSDVHAAQFNKMDSIANHPSAFRADPSRSKPANASLKRSPSKAGLDKPETAIKAPVTSVKRTHSKMDLTEAAKPGQPKPTIRLVPPSRSGPAPARDGEQPSPAKRTKRKEDDDAATTRPMPKDEPTEMSKSRTPRRFPLSAIPRSAVASRLMTPTKASLARSQTVKATKTTSMISTATSLQSSPPKSLFSPSSISETMKEGFRKTSNSLHKVKSILRGPNIKFSDDPAQVAAGTHMSPPPGLNFEKPLPPVPGAASVHKSVQFTESTLALAEAQEMRSPSPQKFRPASEVADDSISYPDLQSAMDYPTLVNEVEVEAAMEAESSNASATASVSASASASPTRRLAFTGVPGSMPGTFEFESNKPVNFGPTTNGTIRMVRRSDASSRVDTGKKRKLNTVEESSDKENTQPPAEESGRSPKKARTKAPEAPNTPASKTPRRAAAAKSGSSISKSRLALLATPKRLRR